MSNGGYSFWNGQPVNAPVYPQMGDLMQPTGQPTAGGSGGGPSAAGFSGQMPGAMAYGNSGGASASSSQGGGHSQRGMSGMSGMPAGMAGMGMQMPMPSTQMGMGDYGHGSMPMSGTVSSPLTCNLPQSFFGQSQGPYEPCIDNGEAFCAYNGMDMSMNYGGGGAGGSMSGGKGGFW
ncbi:hypothetical protein KR067_008928 [Drosophila pandora]|nr:hypothetical protein KR067_008928 [Drosophila pandora]